MTTALATPIRRMRDIALGVFVPPLCPLCNGMTTGRGICNTCWQGLHLTTGMACRVCAIPFPHEGGSRICPLCLLRPPHFDAAHAALIYNDTARALILALKHGDRQDIAPVLARLMATPARDAMAGADMLIPMPLHKRRFLRRRFNQSAEIARHLMAIAGMARDAFRPDILLRVRDTISQGRMTKSQRRRNMQGAFAIAPQFRSAGILRDKSILLVDDVLTTGATMNEAARVLKRAGARRVTAIITARVPEK